MNELERRRYPRYEMKTVVFFYLGGKTIPATVIDISKRGIDVICEQEIAPETEVDISIKYIDDYTIHGTVKWMNIMQKGPQNFYRIGIEIDSILVLSEKNNNRFHERYKFIKDLFSSLEINI